MRVSGKMLSRLTTCFVEQIGDGTTTRRLTPVAVVGLGSGVAMVAFCNVSSCVGFAARIFVVLSSCCWEHEVACVDGVEIACCL